MDQKQIDNNRKCRLCLEYMEHLLPIFGQVGRDKNVVQLLQDHLHLQVDADELLPKHICLTCLETVESFDKFYMNVAHNQSFLLQDGKATITSHVRTDDHTDHEDNISHEEEVIEEPVDLNDSFILQCASTEEHFAEPPSYDEAQETKRTQLISGAINITLPHIDLVDDHCYIENPTAESDRSDTQTLVRVMQNVVIESVTEDDEVNVSEWHVDGSAAHAEEEAGIVIKVDKFKYPRIIRDGKLDVRGDVLDKCIAQFFGLGCGVCEEELKTIDTLFEHYRAVHSVEGYVSCCGRKMEKRSLMAMHMAKHLEPEAFECPHCQKMMTTPRILRYHVRNHLPEAQRPLKCHLCPRRFSYFSALLTHTSTHRAENKFNFPYNICESCGRAYRTKRRLMEHILASHAENGISPCARCNVCGKQFTSKSTLSYHMTTHEPNKHQEKCERCGKWLKNKICLRRHMLQHSDLRYRCNMCDYTTTNGQRMQNHQRVQHTNDKPHVCEECGKAFKLRCNLRNHMPQHTGERNFTCEFCFRQFISSSNYYSHRKRMHAGQMELKRRQKELLAREIRIKLNKQ